HDDLLRRDASGVRFRQLFDSSNDWRAGHGVPAPERFQFLADGIWRLSPLFQPRRSKRSVWGRKCSGCRMVCVRTIDIKDVFRRTQHGFLDVGIARVGLRQHRHGNQYPNDDSLYALPGDELGKNAVVCLAQPCHVRHGNPCHKPAYGGTGNVACRPISWRPLLRYPGGGLGVVLDALLWIFGHPEVYVLAIPAFAFASEIIPVFSRKAIFGYPIMVAATLAIGFIAMAVWAHHMFTVGLSPNANTFFVLS